MAAAAAAAGEQLLLSQSHKSKTGQNGATLKLKSDRADHEKSSSTKSVNLISGGKKWSGGQFGQWSGQLCTYSQV